MKKISIQSMNSLFDCISESTSSVLWIRNIDFNQQIYVSSAFEKIWQRPCSILYTNPLSFSDFLIKDTREEALSQLKRRRTNLEDEISFDTTFFQIFDSKGYRQCIRDKIFMLIDDSNHPVAYMGIGERLSPEEWKLSLAERREESLNTQDQLLQKKVLEILKKEHHLSPSSSVKKLENGKKTIKLSEEKQISVTKRESECLFYLLQGKSAKQTGSMMNVSPRTIETFFEKVKEKLQCRTKIEIVNLLNQSHIHW